MRIPHGLSCLFVFVIMTLVVIYAVYLSSTTPGGWMRHWLSVNVAVVDTFTNVVFSNYSIVDDRLVSTDFTTAPPEESAVNKTGRYVSMCQENIDGRRTGNQMMDLAAMLYVAWLTGRRVAMVRHHPHGWLDRWFRVPVTRVDNINKELCPCATVGVAGGLAYDPQMSLLSKRTGIAGKSLLLCGLFQSWKYTLGVESALRYHLRLLPNMSAAIHDYLNRIEPPAWKGRSFSRIGIHVRAGDLNQQIRWFKGFTIPRRPYFEQAISRFVREQLQRGGGRILFIVTSDSLEWVKKAINFTSIADQFNRTLSSKKEEVVVEVAHSDGHDAGFDLGLLSLCDGVIMSTGTYGWWGAWLANKTTIYYSNWPRAGSYLSGLVKRTDYFPPNWIPIGGPEFTYGTTIT